MWSFHPGFPGHARRESTRSPSKHRRGSTKQNPSLVQAFLTALSGISTPPLPGQIRMLVRKPLPDYISVLLYSHDRSITEWHTLFQSYDTEYQLPQKEIKADEPYNPFFHWKATGVLLQKEYQNHMKLRWIVQKWIQRVRVKLYNRRLIGETDLQTLDPIAKKDAIRVYCTKTKALYQFHVHSITRMIKENLYFEQWGRADPMKPRNPYTNKPWTLSQLIVLIRQIKQVAAHMPSFLSQFVEARYSTNRFYSMNQLQLGISATTRFFKTPDSILIRSELLSNLFEQIQRHSSFELYQIIRLSKCPPTLQDSWETLIHNKWIHDNYGYSPMFAWRDYIDQTSTIQDLFDKSMIWYTFTYPSIVILSVRESHSPEESDCDDSQ
jgi:hypothetical protein